jgi:hypothetical protein
VAKRGQPPLGYYTATQAKRKLGDISDGMLRSYVQQGKIEWTVPKGRKQGFYKREDVDRLARTFDDFLEQEPGEPGAQFKPVTKEDMPEVVRLLMELFGGEDSTERRLSWLEKNPEIAFMVRSKGKIVGCVFVLPLTLQKIEAILSDPQPHSTSTITVDDIQLITPGKPAYFYVVSMGVKPGVTAVAKRTRGEILIRGLLRFFIELGNRGVPVSLIAARTASRDGVNVLRRVGFTEIESNTLARNFIIEVERSGIPFIMLYKKALAEWKAETST